jgi:fatty acid desaturase
MFGLLKFVWLLGRSFVNLLNVDRNELKRVPDETKYLAMIMLSCFWSLAFGLYTGELFFIGYSMIGHVLLITMCFVTWWTFRAYRARQAPYPHRGEDFLRMPDRSSRCDELTDERRAELAKQI